MFQQNIKFTEQNNTAYGHNTIKLCEQKFTKLQKHIKS